MISGTTKLYGIFGHPVEHTFSPGMHNAAFQALHLDSCYVPFAVHPNDLKRAISAALPLGLCGLNITVPHKEKVIAFLDGLSEEAELIGAVNTVEIVKDRLIGHNADGRGFIRSLHEHAGLRPRGKTFLIVGSGGAARAIGFCLAMHRARTLLLYDTDTRKAAALARDIRTKTGISASAISADDLGSGAGSADCLINATPLGLQRTDPLPIASELIEKRHLVCDLVYNPIKTALLQAAKGRGARTMPGIGMLLYQGVIAFEIWTGRKAPVPVMERALARQIRSGHK
jgi:shikimate dehydrogenase